MKEKPSNFSSPSSGTMDLKKWPEGVPPSDGTNQVQRGHDYEEVEVENAKEDPGAAKRAVTPQIKEHPVYVPPAMRNKHS
jgi:hypothetical protein